MKHKIYKSLLEFIKKKTFKTNCFFTICNEGLILNVSGFISLKIPFCFGFYIQATYKYPTSFYRR